MDSWNPTSPPPPKSLPDPLSIPALRDGTIATSLTASSTLPAPLPTPSACSPQPPTPLKGSSSSSSGGMVGVGPGAGPMSPPTPAPSPSPRSRDWRYRDVLADDGQDGDEEPHPAGGFGGAGNGEMDIDKWDEGEMEGGTKGKGRAQPDRFSLLSDFKSLDPKSRLLFLSALAQELQLPEALLVSRKIEPRLKRDFLRELPMELALNCLSYVDDPKTLARASQVSRYWYNLFQDEQTWKDMFDRHRFAATPLIVGSSTPSRPRSGAGASTPASRSASASASSARAAHQPAHRPAPSSTSGGIAGSSAASTSTYTFASSSTNGPAPTSSSVGLAPRLPRSAPPLTDSGFSASANAKRSGTFTRQQSKGSAGRGEDLVAEAVAAMAASEREEDLSFRQQFKTAYLTESNWLRGGKVLASHTSEDNGVVTSLAMDNNYLIIGMANSHIHVFDAITGAFRKSLTGHTGGVWTLVMVSGCGSGGPAPFMSGASGSGAGARNSSPATPTGTGSNPASTSRRGRFGMPGRRASFAAAAAGLLGAATRSNTVAAGAGTQSHAGANGTASTRTVLSFMGQEEIPDPGHRPRTADGGQDADRDDDDDWDDIEDLGPQSDVCNAAKGFGNERAVVVSGGCDRMVKVWDIQTGETIHSLEGHTSTVRCIKVLDGRPIAVTGSRDFTLRVWDINKGELLRTLEGHEQSVRCIEVAGNKVVSGSYDFTCKLWDVDTGECLHTLRGHYHQIYAVAFDGHRVVTGSLDSTVRVWDAKTGTCLSLLQGHTSLVGQLQLNRNLLVTGGSDGRVIVFDLATNTCLHRLCAHDNSVTCLQFDDRFIISGGNDGRVKLWDVRSGAFIRELSRPGDAVWRVAFRDDKCVVLCQREGKTVLELLSFKPGRGSLGRGSGRQ